LQKMRVLRKIPGELTDEARSGSCAMLLPLAAHRFIFAVRRPGLDATYAPHALQCRGEPRDMRRTTVAPSRHSRGMRWNKSLRHPCESRDSYVVTSRVKGDDR
jgi:hypothetical protein